ncbi:MAG: hypothetical protein ABIY51_04425 [Ferruginibacter sp.]
MKIKSVFTTFISKTLLFTCITVGFSSLIVVNAQSSVIGKWNEVSTKQFFTAEGAKQTGKSVIEGHTSSTNKMELEFKSDHTYTEIAGHIKFHTVTGIWSVSGNQLTMIGTAEKKQGWKAEFIPFLLLVIR